MTRVHSAITGTMAASGVDYSGFLNERARRRKPSPIRALQAVLAAAPPGIISLGGGMPNPAQFPFSGLSVTLQDGTELKLSERSVKEALQYSPTPGLAELVARLMRVQLGEHAPPGAAGEDLSLMLGTGSQDLLSKAFDSFLDETTPVLLEVPTYSGTLSALEPIGCPLITVPSCSDGTGIDVEAVEAIADQFESGERAGPRPRLLYVIPTAGNPTGASMPVVNRQRLYTAACRLGCLVIEDDPYRFLEFPRPADGAAAAAAAAAPVRTPSLLSMDTEGRVLRFDSLSKVLSAGLRLGVVTGPAPLIAALGLNAQASCLHTSGVSQALVLELFRHWGVGEPGSESSGAHMGRLEGHVTSVAGFYRAQRDACTAAVRKHLEGPGLAALYAEPEGGMFVWLRVHGMEDTNALVKERAAAAGVLFVPGSAFVPGGGEAPSPFVRASYSLATPEQLDEAFRRFATAIREALAAAAE